MQHLLQSNIQAHADMVMLKELLKRFKANNFSVSVDHYSMQSLVNFTINSLPYTLKVPLGTTYNQLEYYLKEQLPELYV